MAVLAFVPVLSVFISVRNWGNNPSTTWLRGGCLITDTKEPVERRKHERLQTEYGAFVILPSHEKKVGRIVDISPDGLTFIYHTSGEGSAMATELDIFVAGSPVQMYTIPCRTISDVEIESDIHRSLIIRRCGMQFGMLEKDQMFQLNYLIQHDTIPVVRGRQ